MKTYFKYSLIVFVLLYSCTNDKYYLEVENLEDFLIIGENSATVMNIDSTIKPPDRCKDISYNIDLNTDGINDFQYYVYYCYSPSQFYSFFKIKCLHTNAKVVVNDTVLIPQMLNVGDRLEHSMNWISDSIVFLASYGRSQLTGGSGIIEARSYWVNSSNKYMGLLLEDEKTLIFAWVKISKIQTYLLFKILFNCLSRLLKSVNPLLMA